MHVESRYTFSFRSTVAFYRFDFLRSSARHFSLLAYRRPFADFEEIVIGVFLAVAERSELIASVN
jgi:hypothetical protein